MIAIIASRPLANSALSFFLLRIGIAGRKDLETVVARGALHVLVESSRVLAVSSICKDLRPASSRDLGDRRQTVRDVLKLQTCGRREVAGPLASDFWSHVPHGGEHRHT